MRLLFSFLFLLLSSVSYAQDTQSYIQQCGTGQGQQKLEACTWLIQSGQLSENALGGASLNRGDAYRALGDYDKAITDYTQAISILPDLVLAYNNRGFSLSAKGDFLGAIDDYTTAISLNPNIAYLYNNRAMAFRNLGEVTPAIQDYTTAIELQPDYALAYHNRGIAHMVLGDFEAALRDWEKAIDLSGRPAVTRWQQYLKDKGYYAGAIDGLYGPGTRAGLEACARDPECP